MPQLPFVSVIVPVKDRPKSTRELVESFLVQDYPVERRELIVVGDIDDSTWSGISEYADLIRMIETKVRSDGRDANAKRNVGLEHARGDVMVLTDSDIILPRSWIQTGVELLLEKSHEVVAGGMVSTNQDNFLSGYIDNNPVGSKTSRMNPSYVLTSENVGRGRYKQPITANLFLTREVYEAVGGLDANFVTPYEDYPYADMILQEGYTILCTHELDAYHSHRDSSHELLKEYWRAGIGCADYVINYGESYLAKARMRQLASVGIAMVMWIVALVLTPVATLVTTIVALAVASLLMAWRMRKLVAMWYLSITVLLSAVFSAGMVYGFVWRLLQQQQPTDILHVQELSYSS